VISLASFRNVGFVREITHKGFGEKCGVKALGLMTLKIE